VAAGVPYPFYDFNLVTNHKIDNNSATIEAREKIITPVVMDPALLANIRLR
jgi:hypothetical protein